MKEINQDILTNIKSEVRTFFNIKDQYEKDIATNIQRALQTKIRQTLSEAQSV